ncbi:MAG TPA: TPM domain-containing protein [Bacteroidia bacterium]
MPSAKNFFSGEQVKQIERAIHSAEENSSGEIRVHIENRCKGEPLACATKVFHKLEMHKTGLRNAVLFYLAVQDKKFAIVGDEGIHKNVPEGFWDLLRDKMMELFRKGEFTEGLCHGIKMAGLELKKYFPHQADDKNELSDEVTFSN